MIDLRVLRDLWTEDGARVVFAHLVNRCVASIHPLARQVRPDPGDEGIDTFVGEFKGELRVWQAKYFCEGVGDSQQKQIRQSWKKCSESPHFTNLVQWTLCIPTALSIKEEEWWQKWRKQQSVKAKCQIDLWSVDDFVAFSSNPKLAVLFEKALRRTSDRGSLEQLLASLIPPEPARKLPSHNHYQDAIFVRKLEAAGVQQHFSARTAFYNFEILRGKVSHGGNPEEIAALEDLEVRLHALWEHAFNERAPDHLGPPFVSEVHKRVNEQDQSNLKTSLNASPVHKWGGVHYWADQCRAGWTNDFELIGQDKEEDS
ncbi:hypothetical protein [Hyalangium sp.]|uniref:hypothetical protein n=1 Tax=Hyalangium sp. TaxID=2028555 RepID=UPI002D365964|nr:hypothetical protein [Hyalangium sp.]HYH98771.1 hypothetical protein [Hyalangium sp.]